jgi:ribosomal protein S18 acetylase RimI-like enzyme
MIRPASSLDVDALFQLEAELFPNNMNERMLHHELVRGRGWVWGDPVEAYILTRFDEGLVDVLRLGVRTSAQGKGVGRKLLEVALEGAEDVILTVQKTNERAIRLYEKAGFKIVGHLGGAGAWVMRRRQI